MVLNASPFRTGILLIAHAPLASALRACALHVFPEHVRYMVAYDIAPDMPADQALQHGIETVHRLEHINQLLILTDIIGATPFNVSKKIMDTLANTGSQPKAIRLLTGVNVPMLMRALTYRHESLGKLTDLAVTGAIKGVMHISPTHA